MQQKFNSAEEHENWICTRLFWRKLVENQGTVGDVFQKLGFQFGGDHK